MGLGVRKEMIGNGMTSGGKMFSLHEMKLAILIIKLHMEAKLSEKSVSRRCRNDCTNVNVMIKR